MIQANQVGQVMASAVLTIGPNEPITEAIRLFASYPIHHLPVVDKSRVVGILSTADMLKLEYFMPKGTIPAALLNNRFKVDMLMRTPVITATPFDTLTDAASRMSTKGIHALPVVNEANHLIGIVTTTDIMQALLTGINVQHAPTIPEVSAPTEHRLDHAIETASTALINRTDEHGVAACALYLHERNSLLETLRHDIERYLRNGQEERLHSELLKDIQRLDQQQHAALALRL